MLHTTIVRFKVMNQGMFKPYLIPAGSFTLHVKMIEPRVLGYTGSDNAAATLSDLPVHYFTHPLNGKLYIHYIVKKRKTIIVNLFTLNASQLP